MVRPYLIIIEAQILDVYAAAAIVGGNLSHVNQHVAHEASLLEQVLRAGDVFHVRYGSIPKRIEAVEMRSKLSEGVSRSLIVGLMYEGMEDVVVDTFAPRQVTQRFHLGWASVPSSIRVGCSKGLGSHHSIAVDVGNGGSHFG